MGFGGKLGLGSLVEHIGKSSTVSRSRPIGWLAGVSALALFAAVSPVRAQNVVATGDVFPGPFNGSIRTEHTVIIGYNGTGVLNVRDGGQLTSVTGVLGLYSGIVGTATVTGAGSTWNNTHDFYIGYSGTGVLNVEDGGQVNTVDAHIGYESGSTGTVTVTGAGSSWNNTGLFYVGYEGNGTLNIADGGLVNVGSGGAGTVRVGNASGTNGTLNIGAAAGQVASAAGTLNAGALAFGSGPGTLVFNHTGLPDGSALTFAPVLSGNGSVNHLAGTTILTGDSSSFGGTTTISGGSLLIGSGGKLGGAITVGTSGTLGGVGTLSGSLVTVNGTLSAGNSPGTLTVANNLTLNAGSTSLFELNTPGVIGGTGATGNDLVTVGGTLTLGGTLEARAAAAGYYRLFTYGSLSGSFATTQVVGTNGFVASGGTVYTNSSDSSVDLAVLSDGQNLQFWDGNGSAEGGTGTWNASATNWTSLPGGQINDTWRSSVGIFSGTPGIVTVAGTQAFDTLQFSSSDYVLTGGTLSIGAFGGSTLNIDPGVTTTIGSVIASGTGTSLRKTGAGTVVLTGDSSSFNGTTTVSAGKLVVGLAGSGSLGGMVEVLSGATLGGTGTLGSTTIAAGGVHAPGNSIGTQTINGNYDNNGTLIIEANPTTASQVAVNGTVDITGATLRLLLTPSAAASWNIADSPFSYTIIANDGADAVTGRFGTTTDLNRLLFLASSLDYAGGDGNDVVLKLTRNVTNFAGFAGSANQSGTAQAIESLGAGPLYNAVVTQTDIDIVRATFDALSGEVGATARGALPAQGQKMADAVNDRLLGSLGDTGSAPVLAYGPGGPELVAPDTPLSVVWGSAFGNWGQRDGDANVAGTITRGGGLVGGIDGQLGDWRLGFVAGYSRSAFDVASRASTGSSDSYSLGLYGGTALGPLAFRSSLTASAHSLATSRTVAIPGFTDHLSAAYGARSLQAFAELGYGIELTNATSIEPFANLTQFVVNTDGYSETGGAAALTATGDTSASTFTTIGLRASHKIAMGTVLATLHGMAGWRHGYGDLTPSSSMSFAGSTPITVTGAPTPADTALLSTGLDLNLTEGLTIGLAYAGRFANGTTDNATSATIVGKF